MTEKTKYDFRGELFNNRKAKPGEYFIIDFAVKQKGIAGKKGTTKFNDGPNIIIDDQNFTIFDLLYQMNNISPKKEDILNWLCKNTSLNSSQGIYLVDTGVRRGVITTKSLVASVSKVIFEILNATNKGSDIFLKRTARSQTMKIKVLSYEKNYSLAANYAGLYDVMAPQALLSEKVPNYRQYPGYRAGLKLGGNWQTLLIEELLDKKIRPESFVSQREVKIWRDKTFKTNSVISRDEFVNLLRSKISDNNITTI